MSTPSPPLPAGSSVSPPAPAVFVKVMRLALTRSPPWFTPRASVASSAPNPTSVLPAAPPRSLLSLPSVFETIHAGQTLRCLARAQNVPNGAKLCAYVNVPMSGGDDSSSINQGGVLLERRDAGEAQAQANGVADLNIHCPLDRPGQHELVILVESSEEGSSEAPTLDSPARSKILLRKVYRIQVAEGLTLSVQTVPCLWMKTPCCFMNFKLTNSTRDLPVRLTGVSLHIRGAVDKVMNLMSEVAASDLLSSLGAVEDENRLQPSEARTFVAKVSTDDLNAYMQVRVTWLSGLGEAGSLGYLVRPEVPRDDLVVDRVLEPGLPSEAIKLRISTPFEPDMPLRLRTDFEDESIFVHGSLQSRETLLLSTGGGVFVPDLAKLLGFDDARANGAYEFPENAVLNT